MNRNETVAFTGHRLYRGEVDESLYLLLQQLYEQGMRTFLCGMAIGFDMAAAMQVLRLRERYPEVRLVAVIPFAGQAQRYCSAARRRYDEVLAAADERITLSPSYFAGCYQVRNNYLVAHAATLVAWYNGAKGGTQQTFLRALHSGLRVENLGRIQPERPLF